MGRIVTLGDPANIHVDGFLEVFPSGPVRFAVNGADNAQLYVQVIAPIPEPSPRLVAVAPGNTLQQLQLDWIPADLTTPIHGQGWTAAGQTLEFTLYPYTAGKQGPLLVTVRAQPAMAIPLLPTSGSYDGPPWYTPPPTDAANKTAPAPASSTLWDSISAALSGFPGGTPAAIGAGGLALLLLFKKRQG